NFKVSNGTAPPLAPVGVGAAKAEGPGWFGMIRGYVTALFPCNNNTFVVEDEGRTSAITVSLAPSTLRVGQEVIVVGTIQDDGTLLPVQISPTGNEKILDPVGVNNKSMSGSADTAGLSNSDLLVACWGKVVDTPVVSLVDGSTTFHITDGSAGGRSTAQILGPWTLAFEDDFSTRKPEWSDLWAATLAAEGMLQFEGTNKTIVTGISLQDVLVSTDVVIADDTQVGIMLRWSAEFVCATWWPSQKHIYFNEVIGAGNWQNSLGDVYNVELGLPARMSVMTVGDKAMLSVTDGTKTYSTCITLTKSMRVGSVGVYHDAQFMALDNFKVYAASVPVTVDGDLVEVTIPACVSGAISVGQGDYVRVTGIAGKGSTLQGALRGIKIRQADDLSKVQ
ncbi:MAG: hypothetical protein M1133_00710, partial [Armatimonadetes bacterium]|nr:hypothetical protein [Armatimonadota bacterium]